MMDGMVTLVLVQKDKGTNFWKPLGSTIFPGLLGPVTSKLWNFCCLFGNEKTVAIASQAC